MSSSESNVNNAPSSTPYSAPPVIIAFTLGILICFFVSFFFIYLCRCCYVNVVHTWAFQRTASGNLVRLSPTASPYRGLDPSLLQIFPTFSYASVKELHGKKYSLECAICLLEFEDDSSLRLLTFCCHVFHQECIDLWLCSHKTCPVCRTDLESPTNQMHKCQESCEMHHEEISREPLTENEIRIDVKEDESDTSERHEEAASCSQKVVEEQKRFSRSHSTGHSIVVTEGGHNQVRKDDKYTLILPEQIGIKFIKRGGHKYTKSCATYKEMATLCSKCSIVEAISGCSSRGETERA